MFSGTGSGDTAEFVSPPLQPWLIEWVSEGNGPNTIVVSLMAPDNREEIREIVNDTGTGQIGGVNLVIGNLGSFFLHIEGPQGEWKIWITQQ